MSRLGEIFDRTQREHRAALVVYLCAGDPELQTSAQLLLAAAEAGADVLEVGMPFSDPTADGPVIQRASERALASGTTLRAVLGLIRKLRVAQPHIGIVLFGYYNPILAFGEIELAAAARDAGADGVLVVDLPPEEGGELLPALRGHGLDYVPLVAPTTPDARVERIAQAAGSFLYYVSLTGVTGAEADLELAGQRAATVRERTGRPVALGFGIKTPEHARVAAKHADGVIVGSALCAAIEQAESPARAVAEVRSRVAALRAACAR